MDNHLGPAVGGVVSEAKVEKNASGKTSLGVGTRLRMRREELGIRLEDVVSKLRIRQAMLQALEEERYSEMPGKVYVIGFVKSYAAFLQLDVESVLKQTNKDLENWKPAKKVVHCSLPGPNEGRSAGLWALLVAGLLVIIIAYAGWYHFHSHSRVAPSVFSPKLSEVPAGLTDGRTSSDGMPIAPANTLPAAGSALEGGAPSGLPTLPDGSPAGSAAPIVDTTAGSVSPAGSPQEVSDGVGVRALEDSWLELTDHAGKIVFSGVLKKGETWHGSASEAYHATVGNAAGVVLQAGNVVSAPMGAPNKVIRNAEISAAAVESGVYGQGSLPVNGMQMPQPVSGLPAEGLPH